MEKQDKIVILGMTGYIGAWVAKYLADEGYTNIVGTYQNPEKMKDLNTRIPVLQGVQVNVLTDTEQLSEVLQDAKWVFNNSAPFTGKEITIDDFIQTKITAVDNVFHALKQGKSIEKLVHLGSAASVGFGRTDSTQQVINEDDWTDVEQLDYPYERFVVMKTYEEKRVWELSKQLEIPVTVVHPTNVIGPSLTPWQHDMIYAYLHQTKFMADGPMDSVDVRDLAQAEITFMNNRQTDGKRILGLGFTLSYQELVDIIAQTLSQKEIETIFGNPLPKVIPVEAALALWAPVSYTSFYKDTAWRLQNKTIIQTKYPEFYVYHRTDGRATVIEAVQKMLQDHQN